MREGSNMAGLKTAATLLASTLLVVIGCATEPAGQPSSVEAVEWIKVGATTREEMIARYGNPDAVAHFPQGEVAVYRGSRPAAPAVKPSIPVPTAGPFGTVTTEMRPVEPGLGTKSAGPSGSAARPSRTVWIRYDTHGVVQEWSFERLSVAPESIP